MVDVFYSEEPRSGASRSREVVNLTCDDYVCCPRVQLFVLCVCVCAVGRGLHSSDYCSGRGTKA